MYRKIHQPNQKQGFTVVKFGKPCAECETEKFLTRHHLKDKNGKRNGEIEILCRPCHNLAEEEYYRLGINEDQYVKYSDQEELEMQYRNGLIPFYSICANYKKCD